MTDILWNRDIQKWYNSLPGKDKVRIQRDIRGLVEGANFDSRPLSTKDGLYELKVKARGASFRLAYYIDKSGVVCFVFLTSFKKSVQGSQVRDVQNAKKVLQSYKKGNGSYAPPVW